MFRSFYSASLKIDNPLRSNLETFVVLRKKRIRNKPISSRDVEIGFQMSYAAPVGNEMKRLNRDFSCAEKCPLPIHLIVVVGRRFKLWPYFRSVFRTVLRHRSRRSVPEETDFDEKEHVVAAMEREFHIVITRFVNNVLPWCFSTRVPHSLLF